MKSRLNLYVTILQAVYIGLFVAFLLNAFTVDVLFAPPALAILRVPSNLREIGQLLNVPWTQSLKIYHIFLLIISVFASLNLIGLSKLESRIWRSICKISSFFCLLILWATLLFFFLPFIIQGVDYNPAYLRTSLIYAGVIFILFVVDLATFAIAEEYRNRAKNN